jgi:hypothetical protein
MLEIIEGILFKVTEDTEKKLEELERILGLPEGEVIDLILFTYIVATSCISSQKKSLYYLFMEEGKEKYIHIHTISYNLLLPIKFDRGLCGTIAHKIRRRDMSILKRTLGLSMLESHSQLFAAAVDLALKIAYAQLRYPRGELCTCKWGSELNRGSYKKSSISFNARLALARRNLEAIPNPDNESFILKEIEKDDSH